MHVETFSGREYHFVDYLSMAAYRRVQATIEQVEGQIPEVQSDALVRRMLLEGLRKPDGTQYASADEIYEVIGLPEYSDVVKHCEKVLSIEAPPAGPLASTTDSATP